MFLRLRLFLNRVSRIVPSGWDGALVRLSALISLVFLLFLLLNLFGSLTAIGALKSWGFQFLSPGLRFLDP